MQRVVSARTHASQRVSPPLGKFAKRADYIKIKSPEMNQLLFCHLLSLQQPFLHLLPHYCLFTEGSAQMGLLFLQPTWLTASHITPEEQGRQTFQGDILKSPCTWIHGNVSLEISREGLLGYSPVQWPLPQARQGIPWLLCCPQGLGLWVCVPASGKEGLHSEPHCMSQNCALFTPVWPLGDDFLPAPDIARWWLFVPHAFLFQF